MRRSALMLSLVATACGPTMDERQPAGAARVETYLRALTATSKVPGLQYLVMTGDGVLFQYAGGWADLHRQVPMEAGTTMMAYSMSKTITAIAVLQLVQAGKVGLDDPVERYVNGFPYGPGVTVRQLLSHTSGIPNPIPLRWVHPAAHHATFDEGAALRSVLIDNPRLASDPGTKFAYSNIGYWLLGRVVERASGRTFEAYVREHVLRPLDLEAAEAGYWVANPEQHATGYLEKYSFMNLAKGLLIDRELIGEYSGNWLEIRSHHPNGPAFGGLAGCASGFGKLLQDQLQPRSILLDGATRELLYAPQRTTGGDAIDMTLGWHIGHAGAQRFFYKEGGGGGFHSMMRLYPERGLGTVVMTNATGFDVRGLLDEVDAQFLGRR